MSKRPMAIEDLLALPILNDPQLSSDASRVVFTVTIGDRDGNTYRTRLWVSPTDGAAPWQLTTALAKDTGPRWSPDGTRIAFVSDRSGEKQVWVIPLDGGEARVLTSGKLNPSDLAWSPDGAWIAFVGKPGTREAKDESDVRVISRLRYKQDGEGFWDRRWKQVFVIAAAGGPPPLVGGDPRQLTHEECDHLTPAWSPDGAHLAYTANPDPSADLTNISDVWVVPVATNGGAARRLTCGLGPAQSPVWSPDGTRIAYIGHDNACYGATNWGVWTVPAGGGDPVCLTRGFDRSAGHHVGSDLRAHPVSGGITWSPDSRRLFFMCGKGGTTQIASVAGTGKDVRLETEGEHDLIGCSIDRAGQRMACIQGDPVTPGEIAFGTLGSRPVELRRLTNLAGPVLGEIALARPERFEFKSVDGWTVEGWVLRPAGAPEGERIPTVLEIHGGPHAAYGYALHHEFQVLCAQGYGVIYMNPRGSQGYGETFTAATRHDWGGKDYEDLMRGVDHCLAIFKWIDPNRLGVMGGSYGGFMTNWIVGHTQRFQAGVTMRSISNAYSQWGTSDLAFMKGFWEYPGDPWESPQFYLERSPITYVRQMKTPLLILHSENDYRCPIEQGEQLFVALKKQGTPTLFVRFPNESHDLSRNGQPKHRVERLQHILAWLRAYLLPKQAEAVPSQTSARQESVAADE